MDRIESGIRGFNGAQVTYCKIAFVESNSFRGFLSSTRGWESNLSTPPSSSSQDQMNLGMSHELPLPKRRWDSGHPGPLPMRRSGNSECYSVAWSRRSLRVPLYLLHAYHGEGKDVLKVLKAQGNGIGELLLAQQTPVKGLVVSKPPTYYPPAHQRQTISRPGP